MKKVLHIIIGLDIGGAETFLLRLIPKLEKKDYSSIVVFLTGKGELSKEYERSGISIFSLGLLAPHRALAAFFQLLRLVKRLHPDIIQTWMYHSDLLGGLVGKILSIPVVWGVRQSNLDARVNKRLTMFLIRVCAILSRVIPININYDSFAGERAHVAAGYDQSKSSVIPNGVDAEVFSPSATARRVIRSELDIPEDAVVIGHIGRYDVQKDHKSFMKAIKIIHQKMPLLHVVMVGDGINWSNKELVEGFDPVADKAWIHLLGVRSDVVDIFSAMEVFCSSSRGESCPNVVIESMVMGVPCVATDVGDVANMVGDAGVVVRSEDHVKLAQACIKFVSKPRDELIELGRIARVRALKEFSLERAANSFADLYNEQSQPNRKGKKF